MIKKLKAYWGGKSVKQRVCICIVLAVMLTLLFFTVKANFIDKPNIPQTSVSGSAENETTDSNSESYEPPPFHVSLIDVGVLLAVIAAYSVHKICEKKKQGRL